MSDALSVFFVKLIPVFVGRWLFLVVFVVTVAGCLCLFVRLLAVAGCWLFLGAFGCVAGICLFFVVCLVGVVFFLWLGGLLAGQAGGGPAGRSGVCGSVCVGRERVAVVCGLVDGLLVLADWFVSVVFVGWWGPELAWFVLIGRPGRWRPGLFAFFLLAFFLVGRGRALADALCGPRRCLWFFFEWAVLLAGSVRSLSRAVRAVGGRAWMAFFILFVGRPRARAFSGVVVGLPVDRLFVWRARRVSGVAGGVRAGLAGLFLSLVVCVCVCLFVTDAGWVGCLVGFFF
ncbi:hypothetical protein [Pseudomonas syringae]|uniref:hypothetical protein n=1 Tax=Pseudomonas syringae TaxID=317 RepID=UPI001144BB32|nr:hypothetical protein [Pseudomonas syringae]